VIERRERTTGVEDELAVANVAAAVVAGLG
jgi:hypothetical protein